MPITGECEDHAKEELRCAHITEPHHHDQQSGVKAAFQKEVRSFIAEVDVADPLLEKIDNLLVFDTRHIMDAFMAETTGNIETIIETIGKE